MKKNLIVGALFSLGYWEFEPFIESSMKNCSPCDLMIEVYDEMSDWTLDCINQRGEEDNSAINIIIERVPPELKGKYNGYIHFKMIEDFLKKHKGEYDQVLLSDMRDVIIQGDPFKPYAHLDSYLVYATELVSIGTEPINASWIIRHFGKDSFEKIKNNIVACAGTLMGTVDAIQIAVHALNEYLVRDDFNVHGADQATLNYLVYNGKIPVKNIFESSIHAGVICTSARRETPIVNDKVMSLDGKSIPAVCHQYDRHASGRALAERLYRKHEVRIDKPYADLKSRLDIADAYIGNNKLPEALVYLTQFAELNTSEWKTQSDRATKLITSFLSKPRASFGALLIAQALCQIVIRLLNNQAIKTINPYILNMVYNLTTFIKQQTGVNIKNFDTVIGAMMLQIAKLMDQNNDRKSLTVYLDMIKKLDQPLSSEYYLLSAKNNRLLGNREQAIEDYKKALG